MGFLGGYLDVGFMEFLEDGSVGGCGFLVCLASYKDVVCNFAAFALLKLVFYDLGEELFQFFRLA